MKFQLHCVLVASALVFGGNWAHAQDAATLDTQSGQWRLYYKDQESGQWVTKSYETRTAIHPTIRTLITWRDGRFSYHYHVKNGRDAKQLIGVIRVWGIPLVYPVVNLPAVNVDPKSDPDRWQQQRWAQLNAKEVFENQTVKGPSGWDASLRVDEKVGQTSFVWTPGLKDTDPDGIAPGKAQGGFTVLRPELPGVTDTYLQGSTKEPWGLDNLPDTPFWSQKVDEIQDQDFVLVPVMAPIIVVPEPYSGAELARRLRAHVQTWPRYGHATADGLDRLNRQFDVLIPALAAGNRPAARSAATALLREAFEGHASLDHRKLDDDDEEHAAGVVPHRYEKRQLVLSGPGPGGPQLQRVAARALAFNVMYLLARMERGN